MACWHAAALLRKRPAGDDVVNFAHEADGFGEGDDDFLVMVNVIGGELAAFVVLEPLFADLVATDVEFPDFLGHALEVLRVVDIDAPGFDASFRIRLRIVAAPWLELLLDLFLLIR